MYMYMHMHMHMDMCVCTHISPDGHRQTHSDLIREFAFLLLSLYIFISGIRTVTHKYSKYSI